MSFLSNLSSRLKIGTRIYIGFGIVIALLLALAALGYFSLTGMRAIFERYDVISDNTLRVTEAERDIVSARRNLREYIRTNSKESLDRVHEVGNDARRILGTLATSAFAAEQREQAERNLALLDEFMANFEVIIKIQAELNRAVNNVMDPLGARLSAALADIVQAAMDDSDMSGAADAGVVQQQLMLARLNVNGFLLTNDAKSVEKSEQQFSTLSEGLKRLKEVTNDDARQAKVAQIVKEAPDFVTAFRAAVKVVAERARLVDDVNAKLAADMAKTMAEMKAAQVNGLTVLKSSAHRDIASTVMFNLLLTGIALALGLGIAWIIGRGITKPIHALTNTMDVLASGDLRAEVPGTDRGDELGNMATSVLAFRQAAIEKASLEAEAESQRRLSDEERTRNAREQARIAEERAAEQAKAAEEQAQVVKALAHGLARLSEGDLAIRLNEGFGEAYQQIRDDFNSTIKHLQETIGAIVAATGEVTNGAAEISISTTDLSQRTEEQAASLEETSASMEQISSIVKQNAENTERANALTAGTREAANRGSQVVASTVEAMSRIEKSSNKIADIIGIIDEIARQTNLLALNAAVEAARAGDAGRGFAVVASEVRSLAQRSSQAAKDIKDLIASSSTQVREGVDLVNRTGQSLNEIVESINKVADIVADIATASVEQSTGLNQISKALAQMDAVTQQNSALVEENAATAKTLAQQANAMTEEVSFFRVNGSAGQVVRFPAGSGSTDIVPDAARAQAC